MRVCLQRSTGRHCRSAEIQKALALCACCVCCYVAVVFIVIHSSIAQPAFLVVAEDGIRCVDVALQRAAQPSPDFNQPANTMNNQQSTINNESSGKQPTRKRTLEASAHTKTGHRSQAQHNQVLREAAAQGAECAREETKAQGDETRTTAAHRHSTLTAAALCVGTLSGCPGSPAHQCLCLCLCWLLLLLLLSIRGQAANAMKPTTRQESALKPARSNTITSRNAPGCAAVSLVAEPSPAERRQPLPNRAAWACVPASVSM